MFSAGKPTKFVDSGLVSKERTRDVVTSLQNLQNLPGAANESHWVDVTVWRERESARAHTHKKLGERILRDLCMRATGLMLTDVAVWRERERERERER